MRRFGGALSRLLIFALVVTAFTGTALAAGKGKSASPGKSANAPGQQKAKPTKPAKPAKAAKPGKPAKAAKPAKPAKRSKPAKPAKAAKATKADAAANGTAQKKVTLCHATGSATNPFELITVSENATTGNGHGSHADDIIPAPAEGCPSADVVDNGGGNAGGSGGKKPEKITICHATGSATNPFVVITVSVNATTGNGHGDHEDDIIPAPEGAEENPALCASGGEGPGGNETEGGAGAGTGGETSGGATEGSGVAAATASGGAEAAAAGGSGEEGILGVLASGRDLAAQTAQGNLPFTGLPVWVVLFAGAALVALGMALRWRARPARSNA